LNADARSGHDAGPDTEPGVGPLAPAVAAAAFQGHPAVELLGVSKTYANGTAALSPTDLTVREGEFVTLLGPSGCGKSTLLKMVAGLLPPSDGRVRLWRKPVERLAETGRRLGFVFQDATLMPWARVAANVRLPLDLAGTPRAEADARVAQALARVGLQGFERHRPRELSGGMQMRVSIARSLVTEPALLLMDEPFGALDEITRNRLDDDLLALWAGQRLTVLFVTHSIHEAVFLSQRVLVMGARPGRIVHEHRIDEPYPRQPAFRVGTAFAEHARALQDSLLAASGQAVDLALH
jgi:NitT/TauT family transport system ATP-binding protein